MRRTVRIGTVADQDRFRRDDVLGMSPDERVMMVFDWQARCLGVGRRRLVRVATVRSLGGRPRAASRAVEGHP